MLKIAMSRRCSSPNRPACIGRWQPGAAILQSTGRTRNTPSRSCAGTWQLLASSRGHGFFGLGATSWAGHVRLYGSSGNRWHELWISLAMPIGPGAKRPASRPADGVAMVGRCCVKSWSKTHGTVAQSSAGIGLVSLAQDLGIPLLVRLHVDAGVALGSIEWRGVGGVRHLDVGALWLQEQQLRRVVELEKEKGLWNPSDLCTKNLPRDKTDIYTDPMNYVFLDGRADSTASLNGARQVCPVFSEASRINSGIRPDSPGASRIISGIHPDSPGVPFKGGLPQEAKHWFQVSPLHWRASFRGARSHRLPCRAGVKWSNISRIVTRTSPNGRVVRDLRPKELEIT